MAEIEIRGVAELLRRLGAAAGVDKLEPPMQRAVLRVQADMQTYPPAPRTSSYRRTGTYGRRWTTAIVRESGGVIGQMATTPSTAPLWAAPVFSAPAIGAAAGRPTRRCWNATGRRLCRTLSRPFKRRWRNRRWTKRR